MAQKDNPEDEMAEPDGAPPSPPPPPPPPPPPSPEDLAKAVKDAEDALIKAKAALAAKQAADKDADADAAVKSGYTAAKSSLDEDQKRLAGFLETQQTYVEQNAPGVAAKIDAILSDEDKARKTRETDIDKAAAGLQAARDKLGLAQAERDSRKAELEALEKHIPGVRDRHVRAERVRVEVKKAIDAGQYKRAYWLLSQDYAPLVEGAPELIDPDALLKDLLEARTELAIHDKTLGEADAAASAAARALDDKKAALADFDNKKAARINTALSQPDDPANAGSPNPNP